jgi:RNA polymerase sigma-70 factor (ECF subfamily)
VPVSYFAPTTSLSLPIPRPGDKVYNGLRAEKQWDSMRERTNEQWLVALKGPEREETLKDLRAVLVRGLRATLAGRVSGDFDATIEDFAQEALVKILNNLNSFRGESRFTTWAQRIAVHVAFTELRRRKWSEVSLQEVLGQHGEANSRPGALADPQPTPERLATQKMMLETVQRFIDEELTGRQREAMVAVMLKEMPLEEVARRMGTNRNALYKLLHDARKKLKRRMIAEGLSPQEVLAVVGEG